ncbi:uncharacterized protein K460DRAFT_382619 [Cucurbitaria berberidis CBS 394.84]|uniref:F-box domain-containing protein n=1 Tax=Cucurbitaria berberidis CBS 394.84 TaxID=1168544 RepID=A0A9P4GSV1_9PLEO|nr:uncharacterized protein K460DRAFT_382619 [Cucurbitaria berberidis CBS 394.84]KAF1851115.1 hypothetical protein K460DRAFT_382619 [Cucurbitaria berberidis CBS 394.84]
MASQPAIYRLPEELLLQIASQLPDSATPEHLKNMCLVSSKFRPAAQEALHNVARLHVSCGCHPTVNTVVKLLRTLFNRPDLASKIRTLRFRTVRKNIAKLYHEQSFDLTALRIRCLSKLKELGYTNTHPWWSSINNSVESAFAGVVLVLLPNLIHLDFWVKDHHRGPPSSECISGLFGGMTAPEAIRQGWKSVRHLTSGDTHMLKCDIEFDGLTTLDLKTISIGTVLRLNGPGSLQGTKNLRELLLTVSIQFADRPLVEKAEIQFGDLFEALGCDSLVSLKIFHINDGYQIGDDLMTELDAGYFIDQLRSVQTTLETLAITFESTEDETELEWMLEMCARPKGSLKDFTILKRLVLPQPFLFTPESLGPESCHPNDLPSNLKYLEILYPHPDVEFWVGGFLPPDASSVKELTLTCRDEVGTPAHYFAMEVDPIWWALSVEADIEAYTFCQTEGSRKNLAATYLEDESVDEWSEDDEDDDDEDDDDDTDDEMPDAVDPTS